MYDIIKVYECFVICIKYVYLKVCLFILEIYSDKNLRVYLYLLKYCVSFIFYKGFGFSFNVYFGSLDEFVIRDLKVKNSRGRVFEFNRKGVLFNYGKNRLDGIIF